MIRLQLIRRLTAALVAGSLMLASCGGFAATHNVSIGGQSFSPAHIEIAVGDTVVWTSSYGTLFGGTIVNAPSVTPIGTNSFTGCAAILKGQTCEATFDTEGVFFYQNTDFAGFDVTGSVTVTSNAVPVVNITTPTMDQTIVVGDGISLEGNFSDEDGTVGLVEFFVVNDSGSNAVAATGVIAMGTNFTASALITEFIAGTNALLAVVTDNRGGQGTALINVTAQANGDPTVAVSVFRLNAAMDELTVGVAATDPEAAMGGGIAKVEFFFNETLHETVNNANPLANYFTTRIPTAMLISDGLNSLRVAVEDVVGNTNDVTTTFLTSILPLAIDAAANPLVVNANTVSFNFAVEVGVQYRVETSTDLSAWTTRFTFTPTVSPHPYIEARGADVRRFYRVLRDL